MGLPIQSLIRAVCGSNQYTVLEAAAISAARQHNVALWYVPRTRAGVFEDSSGSTPAIPGGPIGLMVDQQYGVGVGGGYNAAQSTSASKPIMIDLPNGNYAANFDGVNDWLTTGLALGGTTDHTIGYAGSVNYVGGNSTGHGVANGGAVSRAWIGREGGAEPGRVGGGAGSATSTFLRSAVFPPAGSMHVATALRQGAVANLYVAGALEATVSGISSGGVPTTSLIGAIADVAGNPISSSYWQGAVAVLWACQSALPDAARAAIERFAAHLSGANYVG